MTMQRIRDYYKVPAKRGMRVKFDGIPGVITGSTSGGMYLRVRLRGDRGTTVCHPTWLMEYIDA